MANVELLQKTLEYIENHPDEWDQKHWHCGTSFCFAGHAAVTLSGGKLACRDREGELLVAEPEDYLAGDVVLGGMCYIEERATRLLDLDSATAGDLFHEANTLGDLREKVAALVRVGDGPGMSETAVKRTPSEWASQMGYRILDPDGWRGKDDPPIEKPLTWGEFYPRLVRSTCIGGLK